MENYDVMRSQQVEGQFVSWHFDMGKNRLEFFSLFLVSNLRSSFLNFPLHSRMLSNSVFCVFGLAQGVGRTIMCEHNTSRLGRL